MSPFEESRVPWNLESTRHEEKKSEQPDDGQLSPLEQRVAFRQRVLENFRRTPEGYAFHSNGEPGVFPGRSLRRHRSLGDLSEVPLNASFSLEELEEMHQNIKSDGNPFSRLPPIEILQEFGAWNEISDFLVVAESHSDRNDQSEMYKSFFRLADRQNRTIFMEGVVSNDNDFKQAYVETVHSLNPSEQPNPSRLAPLEIDNETYELAGLLVRVRDGLETRGTRNRFLIEDTRRLRARLNEIDLNSKRESIMRAIQAFSMHLYKNNPPKQGEVSSYFENLLAEKNRSFLALRDRLNRTKLKKWPFFGPLNLDQIRPIVGQLNSLITVEIRNLIFLSSLILDKLTPGSKRQYPRMDRKSVFLVGAAHAPDLAKQITMLFGEEKTVSIAKSYQGLGGPPQHEEV